MAAEVKSPIQQWDKVMAAVKKRSPVLYLALDAYAKDKRVEGNTVTVVFPTSSQKMWTFGPDDHRVVVLAGAITDVLGGEWMVKAEVAD